MFDFLIDDGRRIEMLDCIFKTTQHPIKSHSTADITMLKLNLTTRVFKLSQNRWKCVEGRGQKRWNTWDYVTYVNVIFFAHARIIIIIIHRDHCELCSSHNSKEFPNHSSLEDEIITRLWQTDTDLCPPKTLHGEGLSFRTSSQITVSGKSLTSLYARGLKLQLAQAESSTKIAQQKWESTICRHD